MTYLQAVSWQDMKRRRAQESNNEKGDKEDWQFFFSPPFCVGEKSLLESTSVLVFA